MRVLLDFHYSDDWADPNIQSAPAAWHDAESIDELAARLHKYTRDVLLTLNDQGRLPDFVQVGNEVNNGLAHLDPDTDAWQTSPMRNVQLLNAGISSVREVARELKQDIGLVMHIAQPENVQPWLDMALDAGLADFDILGVSYYGEWSDVSLRELPGLLRDLRGRYEKDIAVVETAYAWTLDWNDEANNILGEQSLEPGYPATRAGQRRYLIDLMNSVLGAGGLGIVYWEPAWISSRCCTRWGRGSHWENAALFDFRRAELLEGADFLGHDYSQMLSGERLWVE